MTLCYSGQYLSPQYKLIWTSPPLHACTGEETDYTACPFDGMNSSLITALLCSSTMNNLREQLAETNPALNTEMAARSLTDLCVRVQTSTQTYLAKLAARSTAHRHYKEAMAKHLDVITATCCFPGQPGSTKFSDNFKGKNSSVQVQPEIRTSKPHHNKGGEMGL